MAYTTIDDPSAYFQINTYTGDGNDDRNLVNTGNSDLQPDWVWIKCRSAAKGPNLFDSSRGTSAGLSTDNTNAEFSDGNRVQAFQTDGFQLGSNSNVNENTTTFVAWQWKANGGTTTSQTGSDIDSVTQANTTSKFAIITYTGASNADSDSDNNSGAYWRVKHGLGSTPKLAIFKKRSSSAAWYVWHHKIGGTQDQKYLQLQGTNAVATESDILFGNTDWSSTEFEIGAWNVVNRDSQTYVAYMFDEVQGYSKFGFYKGNGSTDGTFVYTGFKPAWIMAKRTDTAKNWYIFNTKFSPFNVLGTTITANNNDAQSSENSGTYVDFLSNGFKWRQDFSHANASGGEHVYMAFAEHPFVSSEGVPVTAR